MPKNDPNSTPLPRSLTQEIPEREHSLSNSLGQDISYDADQLEEAGRKKKPSEPKNDGKPITAELPGSAGERR